MSTFSVPVVRIGSIEKHPNADTLSLTKVEGESVVIRTGDFHEGDLAVYVPVDAVVPETVPGTEFLGKHRRIRAARLRGIYSEGLLLPLKSVGEFFIGLEGEDVAQRLGIVKYEDAVPESMGGGGPGASVRHGGQEERAPRDPMPVYDIESGKKYGHLLNEGEEVVITEKLHGTNARYARLENQDGDSQLFVGSRNKLWRNPFEPLTLRERLSSWLFHHTKTWKRSFGRPARSLKPNIYWEVAARYGFTVDDLPEGFVLYGEIFGQVQDLKYGAGQGEVWLRIFDIYDALYGEWLDWDDVVDFCDSLGLETVPVLYRGPWSPDLVEKFVGGKSVLDEKTIREGIVVKPAETREADHFGRVIVKYISEAYKLRKGGTELH
jgi:RNA ligase (TIGR02306 family)